MSRKPPPSPQVTQGLPQAAGFYDPAFEKDACGVGFVARENGQPGFDILELALKALEHLSHRGATDADEQSGDGAGVLTQLPRRFFKRELSRLEREPVVSEDLGVAMIFFPRDDMPARERSRQIIEDGFAAYGLPLFGWRNVPIDPQVLGATAARQCPDVKQAMVGRPDHIAAENFERTLFLARKEIERRLSAADLSATYFCSFSSKTIVYKGLLMAGQLGRFYQDLKDPLFQTAFAIFHQRYSTNTFPTWSLAQPFRYLGHNGEINTIQGNRNWMRARSASGHKPSWQKGIDSLEPIIQEGGSDSMSLDNALEALTQAGRDVIHSMMMLVPEPWQNAESMRPKAREFYEYHGCLNETWDGPAALVFGDGRYVGGIMDRNGLRPMRYKRTSSGLVILASEFGVIDIPDHEVIEKGRVGPGRVLVVDTQEGKLFKNLEVKERYYDAKPYGQWIAKNMVFLGGRDSWPVSGPNRDAGAAGIAPRHPELTPLTELRRLQIAFGYTKEEVDLIIKPMAAEGKEPVGSMGDDAPLAVLSEHPQHLSRYFKQKFAQVTNPPIDSIRESKMMTLNTYLGKRGNVFTQAPEHAHLLRVPTSMIWDSDLKEIEALGETDAAFKTATLSTLFPAGEGADGMERALHTLCQQAHTALKKGGRILILSDRGVDGKHASIPMLLAVAAVHHHLINAGKRLWVSLIADTADAWEVHHFATLIGYGASVVNPYLALHTIRALVEEGALGSSTWQIACGKFHFAIDQGMLKVMAKMGISTLASYRGAQVFDALGINNGLVDSYFRGTPSKIGGLGISEIADDVLARHRRAFGLQEAQGIINLPAGGAYRYRKGEEAHAFEPQMVKLLHRAVAENDGESYKAFAKLINERPPLALRDLLTLKKSGLFSPIKISEVESLDEIYPRFGTSGMSLGALSKESHEHLAIAMNRIGGRSNSGEGGEDPERYHRMANGDSKNSNVKQVATGRFGVTPAYLCSADELQIKMAQGSKPGEGGQLPGHKNSALISRLRRSPPGIPLISPPPHHDIYSIEDLAQLIYDLRQVNPKARISVKLVSLHGVGTIAAGVAKAGADIVHISGHDGGTGASPLSSIKNAGLPWEVGLAEAHQTLLINNLRSRVRIRVDGGFKTGLDVIKAAALGADEFDFGSIALVAQGCVMVRHCHLNTCPTGIATQDEELRKKFIEKPERVVNLFQFIAQDIREHLAHLGVRRLQDLVGCTEYLAQIETPEKKYSSLELAGLLTYVKPTFAQGAVCGSTRFTSEDWHDELMERVRPAVEHRQKVTFSLGIKNENRSVGAQISGAITRLHGEDGLPDGTITLNFAGSAGQSFGAFCTRGMQLNLSGDANDYVGKGMAGGVIAIRPARDCGFDPTQSAVAGNTCLYGATGGEIYLNGRAGERFAVRNSGAIAVVEGVGHHACEYMTQGTVVILGRTSGNLGAGMSGGVAWVYDPEDRLPARYNPGMVKIVRPSLDVHGEELLFLKDLIEKHMRYTDSTRGREILEHWQESIPKFWKVAPEQQAVKAAADLTVEPAITGT